MGIAERKEREKKRRRNAIIDAAEQVFFSKGVENAKMDEVAKIAELSKGTLYLYFKNKDELFHAIVVRAMEMLYGNFVQAVEKQATGLEKIRAIGHAYVEFYYQQPNYFEALLHQEKKIRSDEELEANPVFKQCKELGDSIFDLMQQAVRTGIADGSMRPDLDPLKLSLMLWGHTTGILHTLSPKEPFLQKKFGLSIEDIVEYGANIIGFSMANPAGKGSEK